MTMISRADALKDFSGVPLDETDQNNNNNQSLFRFHGHSWNNDRSVLHKISIITAVSGTMSQFFHNDLRSVDINRILRISSFINTDLIHRFVANDDELGRTKEKKEETQRNVS